MSNTKKTYTAMIILFVMTIMIIQYIFSIIQRDNTRKMGKSVYALLRKEIDMKNPYLLSQTINDLENVGLFKCSLLRQIKPIDKVYLDLRFKAVCSDSNSYLLNGEKYEKKFIGINGSVWDLSIVTINSFYFYLSLWIARLLCFVLIVIFYLWRKKEYFYQAQMFVNESKRLEDISKISRQLAHDIRSPLTTLNTLLMREEAKAIPENIRTTIRSQIGRIQDIANGLLTRNKVEIIGSGQFSNNDGIVKNDDQIVPELLNTCIEEIISEKRVSLRQMLGIDLVANIYSEDSYGLFAEINLSELKRILSNLINNAVEALPEKRGSITITLMGKNDRFVSIIVSDDGKGIPSEQLPKLAQEGVSYGKEKSGESGSGLGLYHARTLIEKWGGQLKIDSKVGIGTNVIINLPKSEAPNWFVPQITLNPNRVLIILDDDSGIHHIWDNRFELLDTEKNGITVVHLSNAHDFRLWFCDNSDNAKNVFCLSDYELIGQTETGLDLIEELKLFPDRAILVTSHYENEEIRSRCQRLGIKLIPKMLAGSVPIVISGNDNTNGADGYAVIKEHQPKVVRSFKTNLVAYVSKNQHDDDNDVELLLKNLFNNSNSDSEYIRLNDYEGIQKITDQKQFKNVFCIVDFDSYSDREHIIQDSKTIKHCILLKANMTPFDIDNQNVTPVMYKQRERVISMIVKEHFNQVVEVS